MTTKLITYKIKPSAELSSVIVGIDELPWQAVVRLLERHEKGSSRSAQLIDIKIPKVK